MIPTAYVIELARACHAGQMYGEVPYIVHVLGVARMFVHESPDMQVCALFHDALEDNPVFYEDYIRPEISDDVHKAIVLLTRDRETQTYSEYIQDIKDAWLKGEKHGAMARGVKLADLRYNLKHKPGKKLRKRYEKALRILDR